MNDLTTWIFLLKSLLVILVGQNLDKGKRKWKKRKEKKANHIHMSILPLMWT